MSTSFAALITKSTSTHSERMSLLRAGARVLGLATLLLGLLPQARAANHDQVYLPLDSVRAGPFPVACSNLAHDTVRLAQLGGPVSDYWEGIANTDNGANVPRYVTDILAEPASTLQFGMQVPDDRGLYRGFAGTTLPIVLLACYPTTLANIRSDYTLPDGQVVPKMERAGDAPIFPAGTARLPLIVYSHGLGGSPVGQDYLSTLAVLASNGYLVVAPFHGDARITRIRLQDLNDLLYLAREFDRYVELQAMRPLALSRTLDYLLAQPAWAARIDASRIGGFGASLGGEAMLLAMGARLTQSLSTLSSRTVQNEPRIKAAAGYVPYAGVSFLPAFGNDQSGADGVSKPWLAISGTADTTAPIRMSEQAINRMRGSRYLVALEGIEHKYLPEYANDVFTWALIFFDAHVKDDRAALARLVRMGQVVGGLDDKVRVDYTAPSAPTSSELLVTEYRHEDSGHFINAIGQWEVDLVNGYPKWEPTGFQFKVVGDNGFSSPACRFYYLGNGSNLLGGRDSLYLSPDPSVCSFGKSRPLEWNSLGTPVSATRADSAGNCPTGTVAVNVLFNNLQSGAVNHRFVSSNASRDESLRSGWISQGVAFCAPL